MNTVTFVQTQNNHVEQQFMHIMPVYSDWLLGSYIRMALDSKSAANTDAPFTSYGFGYVLNAYCTCSFAAVHDICIIAQLKQ